MTKLVGEHASSSTPQAQCWLLDALLETTDDLIKMAEAFRRTP